MTDSAMRHVAAIDRCASPPRWLAAVSVAALTVLLAACASKPAVLGGQRDGAESRPPSGLSRVPDAEPRVEPIRSGGPNKPYEVLGKGYTPSRDDTTSVERGIASWYGKKFHGRRTASGETYNMYAMTAAHKTMPIPSYARVRNPKNQREIIVRINDRGPFHAGRIIDLSYTAALKLGLLNGIGAVEVERITHEQIRTGAWRREGDTPNLASADGLPDAEPAARPQTVPQEAMANESAPSVVAPAAQALAPDAERDAAGTATPAPDIAATAAAASPQTAGGHKASTRALTSAAQGFWVQLGAFRQREGAEQFQRRVSEEVDWIGPLLAVFTESSMFRLQAGPYPSRDEAQGAALRLREVLQLVPVVLEKRR